jgi:hypothetical protein
MKLDTKIAIGLIVLPISIYLWLMVASNFMDVSMKGLVMARMILQTNVLRMEDGM